METTATMKIDQDLVHSGLPSLDFAGTVRVLLTNRLSAIRHLPAGLLDDVLLVASELINNACEATPEDTITFKASFERRSIWVGVWDSRNDPPRPKPLIYRDDIEADVNALNEDYESEEIGGWGLNLVMALTHERNWERTTQPDGKWVCARLGF